VVLGKFIDDYANKDALYPPHHAPGIDLWFSFIQEHFRITRVSRGQDKAVGMRVGAEDTEIHWQMKKPFEGMCQMFPLFVCGKLTWMSPADAEVADLSGFVFIRQGRTGPAYQKESFLAMNVYINTNIAHPNLPIDAGEMIQTALCPKKDIPRFMAGTPHWQFQSSAQACCGVYHFMPGGEMGSLSYPCLMLDSPGPRPWTSLSPHGTADYPDPSSSLGRRQVPKAKPSTGGGGDGPLPPAGGDVVVPIDSETLAEMQDANDSDTSVVVSFSGTRPIVVALGGEMGSVDPSKRVRFQVKPYSAYEPDKWNIVKPRKAKKVSG